MKKNLILALALIIVSIVMLTSCDGLLVPIWPTFDPPGYNPEGLQSETASVGLEYELITNADTGESYYKVVGRGTCTDEHIIIPRQHEGIDVTAIGSGAFMNDISLIGITFSNRITHIYDKSFVGTSITKFEIPDSVVYVGSEIFAKSPVKELIIGKNCKATYGGEFSGSAVLETITVDKKNENFEIVDGVLYSLTKKENGDVLRVLVQYPAAKPETSFTVPENVAGIGTLAFAYTKNLEEITIPADVEMLLPFVCCDSLKSVRYQVNLADMFNEEEGLNNSVLSSAVINLTSFFLDEFADPTQDNELTMSHFSIEFNDETMTNDEFLELFYEFRDYLMSDEGSEGNEPDTNEPEGNEPEGNEPDTNEPDTNEPEETQPDNNGAEQ